MDEQILHQDDVEEVIDEEIAKLVIPQAPELLVMLNVGGELFTPKLALPFPTLKDGNLVGQWPRGEASQVFNPNGVLTGVSVVVYNNGATACNIYATLCVKQVGAAHRAIRDCYVAIPSDGNGHTIDFTDTDGLNTVVGTNVSWDSASKEFRATVAGTYVAELDVEVRLPA